jgi:lipopolysaccharide/colanic/teichoic acid biosynthesis glycosyltransferase
MSECVQGLSLQARILKRIFDIAFSLLGLVFLWWLILIAALLAMFNTGQNGFFTQVRIGRFGKPFKLIKIRTMRDVENLNTTVTTSNDVRITRLGRFLRKTKVDELPQLVNVLLGQMSFVGPRPDVPGFADKLSNDDRVILSIRPGITGPASLKYRGEEELLASVKDPEKYNREIIYPDKVRENKAYIKNYSFLNDIRYILKTFID